MSISPRGGAPLRVALLGVGTVGRSVAKGLVGDAPYLARAAGGRPIILSIVAERDPARARGIDLPNVLQTSDAASVVSGPDVDVVVELIGGIEPAHALVLAALRAGKGVVTANKAMLARHGAELEAISREAGAALRFEAAVGGGIPVLAPLATDLSVDHVRVVRGIVNGSTNYLLTAMTEGGRDYDDVVAEARELGYLEADPSADVEGRDAADKVAILVRLAFGGWPDVAALRRSPASVGGDGPPGVTGVTAAHIRGAGALGMVLKLVGIAEAPEGGPGVRAGVVPAAVPVGSTLGSTNGVRNLIEVVGDPVGRVSLAGPGAGGPATSSAVLADIAAIARGAGSTWAGLPPAGAIALDGDLLDGERRWLAFPPARLAASLPERLVEAATPAGPEAAAGARPLAATGEGPEAAIGEAILLRPSTLAEVRGALRAAGADRATTIYPVVEAD